MPVGTAGQIAVAIREVLAEPQCHLEFDVASNPQFLRDGCAIDDFMKPDRIVVDCGSTRTEFLMREPYTTIIQDGHPFITMDTASEEMTMNAANAMLAL